MPGSRSTALRRYPALGYLAGTAALALLLPSGLTVPNSGPPTLAEYAPVPGQGEGSSDTADLGLPSSTGLGAGGGEGALGGAPPPAGAADPPPLDSGSGVRRPGTKRCVGSPPQQTEDPLSPPCIAFFEGDNGGATAKGVTRDEVTVVLHAAKVSRDRRTGELIDCAEPVAENDSTSEHLCRAYMRYFNSRYQTYGRTVHLYSAHDLENAEADERRPAFGFVGQGAGAESAKRLGSLAAGYDSALRASLAKTAPHGIAFRPDYDDMADLAAGHICNKLANRPARYAGDATLAAKTRKFAFWTSGAIEPFDELMISAVHRRCNIKVDERAAGTTDQTVAARFKAAAVTTVLVAGGELFATLTQQATRAQWFPEWLVPGARNFIAPNINYSGRLADPLQWRNAFAMTVDYRRPALTNQTWYRAFREGCPDCPEPSLAGGGGGISGAFIYDALTMLFYGIQAAGPRLTIANVDKGLHAIPPRGSPSPYQPAAYFAPGNSTFIKDATAMWWDPTGVAPGATERGCWRLAHEGRRFRAGEWTAGDADLRAPGGCQGDLFRG